MIAFQPVFIYACNIVSVHEVQSCFWDMVSQHKPSLWGHSNHIDPHSHHTQGPEPIMAESIQTYINASIFKKQYLFYGHYEKRGSLSYRKRDGGEIEEGWCAGASMVIGLEMDIGNILFDAQQRVLG